MMMSSQEVPAKEGKAKALSLMRSTKLLQRGRESHVEYEIVNRHYAHVDCAGHADYVKEIPITTYYLEESQLCLEEDFFIQLASSLCGILGLLICGPHLSIAAKIGIAFGVFFVFLLIVVGSVCWWKRRQNILNSQRIARVSMHNSEAN